MKSTGWKIISLYFILVYLIPMAGNELFKDSIEPSYHFYPLTLATVLIVFGTYAVFCLLLFLFPARCPANTRLAFAPGQLTAVAGASDGWYQRIRPTLAILFPIIAIAGYVAGWSTFRYGSEGISAAGSSLLLVFVAVHAIVETDLFCLIFLGTGADSGTGSRRKIDNILMAIAFLISTNGTGSMARALLAFAYSVFPASIKKMLFTGRGRIVRSTGRNTIAVMVSVLILFSAWLVGETIKGASGSRDASGSGALNSDGVAVVVDRVQNAGLSSYLYMVLEGRSSFYYSLGYATQASVEELNGGEFSVLVFPLRSFLFRADYVLGHPFGVEKPVMGSLMRWNYTSTSLLVNDRAGTSPGLIASFVYVFPSLPVAALLAGIFLLFLAKLIDRLTDLSGHTPSWAGCFLMLLFVETLFQSPFDFLTVLDDSIVLPVVLLALYIQRRNAGSRRFPRTNVFPRPLLHGEAS